MARRSAWEPGNIFEVALPGGGLAYGIVVGLPLVAFFDLRCAERPRITELLSRPAAFRIWVMRSCVGRNGWPVIDFVGIPDALSQPQTFYKFDVLARRFSLYSERSEQPATREQCLGLECAAVWSAVHVESRLDDHFEGRPNRWAESLNAANRPA